MKNKIYILLFGFLIVFSSCENFFEQTVSIDVPEEKPRLGVTAMLFQGGDADATAIMVSKSVAPLADEKSSRLSNAIVKLFEEGELIDTFDESTNPDEKGVYYPSVSFLFKEGKSYKLEVSAEGLETVFATKTFPTAPKSSNVSISLGKKKFHVTINDEAGDDYYTFHMEDIYLDDNGLSKYSGLNSNEYIVSDETFKGKSLKQIFPLYFGNTYKVGDTVDIYISKVDEDYYRFGQTYSKIEDSFGPFSEPVILHRNIENGYGIFSLGNRKKISVEITE